MYNDRLLRLLFFKQISRNMHIERSADQRSHGNPQHDQIFYQLFSFHCLHLYFTGIYSCSFSVSWFSESFKASAAQISAAKAIHNTSRSFVKICFIILYSPYGCSVFPCGSASFSNFGIARPSIFHILSSLIMVSSRVPVIIS